MPTYDALVTERLMRCIFQKDAIELIMSMTEELENKAMEKLSERAILHC
ncbi:MAG: hypothetical protein ACLT33_05400 [Lachnospira pectinoschiza]